MTDRVESPRSSWKPQHNNKMLPGGTFPCVMSCESSSMFWEAVSRERSKHEDVGVQACSPTKKSCVICRSPMCSTHRVHDISYSNSFVDYLWILDNPSSKLMHLSECLTFSSPFHSTDISTELSSCISQWLLRRTTEFNNDKSVNLPWYFGALCLSYTIGGVGMIIVKPKWTKRSNYPYVLFALFLTLVQGTENRTWDFDLTKKKQYIHFLISNVSLYSYYRSTIFFRRLHKSNTGLNISCCW